MLRGRSKAVAAIAVGASLAVLAAWVLLRLASTPDRTGAAGSISRDRAAALEDSKPKFAGWKNSIYIFPDPSGAPIGFKPDASANATPPCPGRARILSELALKRTPYFMDVPSRLPPGAVEREGIYAEACGRTVVLVSRQFDIPPHGGFIGVVLRPRARGAPFSASADRLRAISVDGRPAVAIAALMPDGSGNSAVFILTARGLLQVGGFDVRFQDLLKVTESTASMR